MADIEIISIICYDTTSVRSVYPDPGVGNKSQIMSLFSPFALPLLSSDRSITIVKATKRFGYYS